MSRVPAAAAKSLKNAAEKIDWLKYFSVDLTDICIRRVLCGSWCFRDQKSRKEQADYPERASIMNKQINRTGNFNPAYKAIVWTQV